MASEATFTANLAAQASNPHMWAMMVIIAVAVWAYFRERFSIEAISLAVTVVILLFFELAGGLSTASILAGFGAPALIAIMALLVVGQGMFQTGAMEAPIARLSAQLDRAPRRTLVMVFGFAFVISMFMNNTPVVVMFIPVLTAIAATGGTKPSQYLMPLSFVCILAGMTTLIGSSTNLLVNDTLLRQTGEGLGFFTQFGPGLVLSLLGIAYIVIAAPLFLPQRDGLEDEYGSQGKQFIAQIRITPDHPLEGVAPIAGLYTQLKSVTVRMVQSGETTDLPPFERRLQAGDTLIVAATRKSLSKLLSTDSSYLRGMLDIAGFHDSETRTEGKAIVLTEAVIAPASRMIGRSIEQIGFRRSTGTLVLGIQRRSDMIRKRMLDIRLEAGDVLLLFGYESDMTALRRNRDLLLLEWASADLPDIRKAATARLIFGATIFAAALGILSITVAALAGALAMIGTGCLNVRQAVRALDMRIFLLIGAAFAMGLGLEATGGAAFIGAGTVALLSPLGVAALFSGLFLVIAVMTNLISNSATALLFAPIALAVAEEAGVSPLLAVLTVIFAANCSFATPIAYQTNLLVMGPGRYRFGDFLKFGLPLIGLLWLGFTAMLPVLLQIYPSPGA